MFIHAEDGTEVQMKIFNDGFMAVHCPRCDTVWSSNFIVIPKEQEAAAKMRVIAASDRLATIPVRPKSPSYVIPDINIMGNEVRQRIMASAKSAFPEAFK